MEHGSQICSNPSHDWKKSLESGLPRASGAGARQIWSLAVHPISNPFWITIGPLVISWQSPTNYPLGNHGKPRPLLGDDESWHRDRLNGRFLVESRGALPQTRQTPDELQHNGGIRNGIVRNAGSCSNVSLSLFDVCVFWGGYLWDGFSNHGLCKQQPWSQQITKKHMLGVGTAPPNTKNHRPPISIGRALPLKNDQNHDEPKS